MFVCEGCGRTAPADVQTGYDSDRLCRPCQAAEEELQDRDTLEEDADYQYDSWRARWAERRS